MRSVTQPYVKRIYDDDDNDDVKVLVLAHKVRAGRVKALIATLILRRLRRTYQGRF